jgi:hypothetical protein
MKLSANFRENVGQQEGKSIDPAAGELGTGLEGWWQGSRACSACDSLQ